MNKRHHIIYFLSMILLLIAAFAGWFGTDYIGNSARQEIIWESQASLLTLSVYVSSTLDNLEEAVKSLSDSPWIAPALLSKRGRNLDQANSVLDRYNASLNVSVSYLMDADGMTVASSNRHAPDSFMGKFYGFRPYFQEAAKGQAGRYFALGITSGKRGFYTSYPVRNRSGHVLGVVALKKNLDEMEVFFSKFRFCFLINPDGIIFLSSNPAMALKSLWPLDKTARERLIVSRQLGNKFSDDVFFKKKIDDGMEVASDGKDFIVSRKVINSDGWSIVLLTPTNHIWISKLIGILVTVLVCIVIMVFAGFIYLTGRSQEAIRRSEESKRLLLHAAGEGILGVDTAGQMTFINPAALRMLGFSVEEMLGQRVHVLIHHSHEDGSKYPEEDCPMYASYAKAIDKHVVHEVLWRKDGSSFPVDYSSTPIIRDGKIMGAVVTFKDITERKQAAEALKASEEKHRILFESSRDAIMTLVPPSWRFTTGNPATLEMFKVSEADFIAVNPWELSPELQPDGRPSSEKAAEMIQTAMAKGSHFFEWTHRRLRGESFPATVLLTRMCIGEQAMLQATVRDITERKQMDEKIRQMAYHDSLTGLPNRKLFSDRLGIALAQARRNNNKVGIAMLDLDKFKNVNDTLGHDVGDLLLIAATERLTAALRKSDTVARFGGDEFSLILPGEKVVEDVIQIVQKIVDIFSKPFLINNHQLAVTTSIGIAVYPDDGIDEGMLLKNADIALYRAKEAGRSRYQLYTKYDEALINHIA
jgi:diguanylate cyclase (GGDEF)-like protein/PAS domain S-box-containing protein